MHLSLLFQHRVTTLDVTLILQIIKVSGFSTSSQEVKSAPMFDAEPSQPHGTCLSLEMVNYNL